MDTTQKPIIGDANTIPNLEASGQALLNRNLTTQQITPTSPLNLNSTITQPTDNGSNIVTSASSTSADIQKYLDMVNSQQPSETQNTFNDLVKSLSGDTSLTGRGQAQLSAEQSAGLPDFYKNLADVNSQITTRTAEYNKMLADMEVGVRGSGNTDIRSSLLYGQQGAVNRQGAAEIGLLEARALGLQGKISAAQTAVNRAVDLMYQDREALYNQKLKQLELIQPMLNAEEKKRSDATAYALKNEADKLAEEKQTKKDIQNIAIEAAKNGAPQSVISSINNASSAIEAASLARDYLQDPLDVQYKKAQIAKMYQDIQDSKDNSPAAKAEQEKLVAQSVLLDNVSLVDSILGDPNLSNVVGMKTPGAWFNGFGANMFGTKSVPALNKIKQLQGLLALENRAKLKGSGAISDFEARTLERSSSSFSRGLSNKDAVTELNKIRGVFATSAGLNANVKITDPSTGKSQIVSANRGGIEQAIIDGLTVEYQ